MPSAKSGTAGSAIPPDEPKKPKPADQADPGKMSKLKAKGGPEAEKYQTEPVPFKESDNPDDDEELSWIEIELVGEDDEPIPGEKYKVTLPDGKVAEGTLDQNGFKRLERIPPGNCQITFPKLDKDAWEKI